MGKLGLGRTFAWIGGRHGEVDRFKLYCDIPDDGGEGRIRRYFDLPRPDLVRPAKARMAAINLADQTGEIYYRAAIHPQQLNALLSPCGRAAQAGMMRARIEREHGRPLRDRLPGGDIGISYARRRGRIEPTVYLFARPLWGGDARIRRRWLEREDTPREAGRAYALATSGMVARRSAQTRHAMVGFHLTADSIELSLGVRPEVAQ